MTVAVPPSDPAARIDALERQLQRQRAVTKELESLVENRTRELFMAMEKVKRQARLVGARTAIALLGEHGSLEDAAPHMLREFGEQLEWQHAMLWMRHPTTHALRCVAAWSAADHPAPAFSAITQATTFTPGVGLPGRVWETGKPAWISDVANEPNFPRQRAATSDGVHAGCAFPIFVDGDVHAAIELFACDVRSPDEDLLVTFAALGSQIGHFIERMRAQEQLRTRELEIAKRIQTSLLPRAFEVPGLEIAAAMVTADDVGGDYYDVLPFTGGAWLGIGDVSGHGVGAGMIMIMIQSAIAALTRCATSPSEVVVALNSLLHDNIRGRMRGNDHVTFSLLRYTRDGRVRFAGAHEDFVLYRAATGDCELVELTGTWLAAKASVADVTHDRELQLHPGDVLVLYTDGILEARDAQRRQFGIARLRDEVRELAGQPALAATEIRDAIIRRVLGWGIRVDDDLSVMVLRYQG